MNRFLTFLLVAFLFATPTFAQGTFDYTSPTLIVAKTSTTVTVFTLPVGLKTLDCPSTGILGLFCAEVDPGDTAGFEGDLPSDLQIAEIDQGYDLTSPAWEIPDGCIDSISSIGKYTLFSIDDDGTIVDDIFCDPDKGVLGRICSQLEVGDCSQFAGTLFPGDHDHPGERQVVVIRAEE